MSTDKQVQPPQPAPPAQPNQGAESLSQGARKTFKPEGEISRRSIAWSRLDSHQFGDSTASDPFGDVDVSVGVETGVVWVHEPACGPFVRTDSHFFLAVEHAGSPVGVIT